MVKLGEWARITDIFGLRDFRAGRQPIRDNSGEKIGDLILRSFWLVETHHFGHVGNRGSMLACVVDTSEWHRGLILLPKQRENIGESEIQLSQAVDIAGLNDPVMAALESVNLVYDDNLVIFGSGAVSYTLVVGTKKVRTQFELDNGPTGDRSLERLWNALTSAINYLVDRYDNEEMRRFIAPPKVTFD